MGTLKIKYNNQKEKLGTFFLANGISYLPTSVAYRILGTPLTCLILNFLDQPHSIKTSFSSLNFRGIVCSGCGFFLRKRNKQPT